MATSGVEKFKNSLKKYFPRGVAWNLKNDSNIAKLIESFSLEFCRIQDRFNVLLKEIDPRNADELLTDWEESLGLPDECSSLGASVEERQNQVLQKLTNTGGSSFEYFENVALNLGFVVNVSDFCRFKAGQSHAGDNLTNANWDHWFQVAMSAEFTTIFKAGSGKAGQKLIEVGNDTLECTFKKLKPAQSEVLFVFV